MTLESPFSVRIGCTLSQKALACHLYTTTGTIRRKGERVTRHGETWARIEHSNRRCAGYKLVSRSR
jgi:hypothetical protein